MENEIDNSVNTWNEFRAELLDELEKTKRANGEVQLMLEQSQGELNKLAQRNAQVTARLQQTQSEYETVPRMDLLNSYNAALDSQQRYLVMRGQLEKLQEDQNGLQKRIELIEKVQAYLGNNAEVSSFSSKTELSSNNTKVLEMLINSQETERQKLSRAMHDGPAQALSNFIVQTEIASRLFEMDQSKAKEELENLKKAAMHTFQQIRSFISDLRPMSLDDLGLVPTIRRYADLFKEQNNIDIDLDIKGIDQRLEPYFEVMIFRSLQELVVNAYKNNKGQPVKLHLSVKLVIEDKLVKLVVIDNGKGFDPTKINESGGLGLNLIKERVEMLGGFLDLDAAVGQGSRISFQVPVVSKQA